MSQQDFPSNPTLKQLYDVLLKNGVAAIVEGAIGYLGLKAGSKHILREDGDEVYISKLLLSVSEALVLKGDLWTKEVPKKLGIEIQKCLETIELIDNLSKDPQIAADAFLLRLLACTNPKDPWMTPTSSEITRRVCNRHSSRLTSPEFLVDQVLKNNIRPLFSNSRPATITSSARKAINPDPRRPNEPTDIDPGTKPWKFEFPATITVFGWVIDHADTTLLIQNWHLFIPALISLLDDPTPTLRSRAIHLLHTFLKITPASLLKQTGLGEVFTEAIFPTLLFLPSLTPTADSLMLLKPAYAVLYELADLMYPSSSSAVSKGKIKDLDEDKEEKAREKERETEKERQKFLSRILRQGILQGHLYANEDIQIIQLLISELGTVIRKMGMQSVKHLKQIIPILTTPLSDPFLPSLSSPEPNILTTSLHTTQILIQNAWPRICQSSESPHRNQLINALCICWIHLNENQDHKETGGTDIRRELEITGMLLVKGMEAMNTDGTGEKGVREELRPVLEVDKGFEELFFGHSDENSCN